MGMTKSPSQPIQRIFRANGTKVDRFLSCTQPDPEPKRVRTIADQVPVTQIMTSDITCARRDLPVASVAALMIHSHIGCVPVIEEPGRPIGMITKRDLVEQMVGMEGATDAPSARSLAPRTANELMMPLAITLGEHATIAHAAALMAAEDVHHTPIVDGSGRLIGIVSTMDIVRWLARNDGFQTA